MLAPLEQEDLANFISVRRFKAPTTSHGSDEGCMVCMHAQVLRSCLLRK